MKGKNEISREKRRLTIFIICMFLVMSSIAVYRDIQHHEFVNFDDDMYIFENLHLAKGLTGTSIAWAFTTSYSANWHPLTWISHLLDVQLYGMNAGKHHLTSLLFHILNTLLLFLVLKRMTGTLWRSGFVAALFALHPLHVESVAWAAERKDVLSTFFMMLTLWAYSLYVEKPVISRYLISLIFFIMGLMSKPMIVTLPFIGLLIIIAWGFSALTARRHFRKATIGLAITTIALLFVITGQQVGHWRNSITLFEHAIDVTSDNYVSHNNLGYTLVEKGRIDEAIHHLNEAVRIKPRFEKAYNNLGIAIIFQLKIPEAIASFENAVKLKPDYGDAHFNLGLALYMQGQLKEAKGYYRTALCLSPDDFELIII